MKRLGILVFVLSFLVISCNRNDQIIKFKPIGLSLVKLNSIVENILFISNVDAFDNTPVLDIKPFLPSVDYVYSEINTKAEFDLGHHNEVFISDSLVKVFVKGESEF